RLLRLRETEHGLAVGVGEVVGHALERRHRVALTADVAAHAPRAGPARQPAVAQVQVRLDQSRVRPAAHLEPGARLTAAEIRIAQGAGHRLPPSLDISNEASRPIRRQSSCPIFVRYTGVDTWR